MGNGGEIVPKLARLPRLLVAAHKKPGGGKHACQNAVADGTECKFSIIPFVWLVLHAGLEPRVRVGFKGQQKWG